MKRTILAAMTGGILLFGAAMAQSVKSGSVPAAAKATWEKEKGNFEANWGGKSGEDMSVVFTPAGEFVEQIEAISVSSLPAGVSKYVAAKYKSAKVAEAGKVTDAAGKITFEAEVKGKDLIFDEQGNFVKID